MKSVLATVGLIILIGVANSRSPRAIPAPPKLGARCMGSNFELGLDNVPINNEVSTSIMNMWVFTPRNRNTALGWLFKNKRGDLYVQFRTRATNLLLQYASTKTYIPGDGHRFSIPAKVSIDRAFQIETDLGAHGVIRLSCFTKDLPKL